MYSCSGAYRKNLWQNDAKVYYNPRQRLQNVNKYYWNMRQHKFHGNVEHEYIFSKYYWNLIKNIILPIFRREAWNYLNNCLHICVFMYVCFWNQKKFLSFNRFSLILFKKFEFQIKRVWFERWNFKFRLTLENEVFYISETL